MFYDLNLAGLREQSLRLAKRIEETGYKPQHVLYIERAGLLVGQEIAHYFDCGISGIYSSRCGHFIKSKAKSVLRCLPRSVSHLLRDIECKSNIHAVKKQRKVHVDGELPPKGKPLLIVDDAIDTGHTLKAVLDFLRANRYSREEIKTGVLTTTGSAPACKADVSLFEDVLFTFPWSYDSREYNVTWKIYTELKAAL